VKVYSMYLCSNCDSDMIKWETSGGKVVCLDCKKTTYPKLIQVKYCPKCKKNRWHTKDKIENNYNWNLAITTLYLDTIEIKGATCLNCGNIKRKYYHTTTAFINIKEAEKYCNKNGIKEPEEIIKNEFRKKNKIYD